MIVMPANNSKMLVGYLAGKYPGRVGHLYSPGGFRGPYPFMPYAIDNGRFASCENGVPWNEAGFVSLCERAVECGQLPLWITVPDVVGDRDETLREWDRWRPKVEKYGVPLAMAAQDGMTPQDIPDGVVCFLGGSTVWKRRSLYRFCAELPRVHVGRINTERWLWECDAAGAESCDGTGWFRGDDRQLAGLVRYLDRSSRGLGPQQGRLFEASNA